MKDFLETVFWAGLLVVLLVILCPSKKAHQEKMTEELQSALSSSKEFATIDLVSSFFTDKSVTKSVCELAVKQLLVVKNYKVVSLGYFSMKGEQKLVSLGISGVVIPLLDEEDLSNLDNDSGSSYSEVFSEDPDGYVNVRSKPSSSSDIVSVMYNDGEGAKYLGESGNWYKVNHNGQIGFVHKDHVRIE